MTQRLLELYAELQALITRREAMLAMNASRSERGYAQAYAEESFEYLREDILRIASEARRL